MNLNEILLNLSNNEIENELLGAIFLNNSAIKKINITENAFYDIRNKTVFAAMKILDAQSYEIEFMSVWQTCKDINPNIELYDHVKYLNQTQFTSAGVNYNSDRLIELQMKREQVKLAFSILKNVESEKYENLNNCINQELKKIESIKPVKENSHISNHFDKLISSMESDKKHLKYSKTNFRDLDKILNGLNRKELVIVGANPSTGKTVLATNIAENHALQNDGINIIFSLEMSAEGLAQRMLASLTNIQSQKIKDAYNKFETKDWQKTLEVNSVFGKTKTEIFENSSLTVSDIKSLSYQIREKYKGDESHIIIYIDYLGLIKKIDPRQNTREHMKDVSVELKNLAKELDATVIALSQLSRDNEKEKRKPIMADLKESGDIEAAADVVITLYREDYQGRETEKKDIIELHVLKNRNGDLGTAEMKFIKTLSKFINIG